MVRSHGPGTISTRSQGIFVSYHGLSKTLSNELLFVGWGWITVQLKESHVLGIEGNKFGVIMKLLNADWPFDSNEENMLSVENSLIKSFPQEWRSFIYLSETWHIVMELIVADSVCA